MAIPLFLTSGASVSFTAATPAYDAADGYSGLLELVNAAGKISLTSASSDGTTHTFTASMSTSAGWAAGRYAWQLSAVKSGEKWPLERGEIEIRADLAAASALDARSHLRKVLDAVEASIERRATKDQQDTKVTAGDGGTIELKRLPLVDLLKLRGQYQAELRQAEAAANLAAGRGNRNIIRVRF